LRAGASSGGAGDVGSAVCGGTDSGWACVEDFGCHFFRSGVGVGEDSVASVAGGGSIGPAFEGDAGVACSEDAAVDLGCHFLRSTEGVAAGGAASTG